MPVTMNPVESQMLSSIGFDEATGELHVTYGSNPQVYFKDGYTAEHFKDLMDANATQGESVGQAFHAIRGNPKEWKKL